MSERDTQSCQSLKVLTTQKDQIEKWWPSDRGFWNAAQTGRSEIEEGPLSPIPIPEMEVMVPTKKSSNYSLAGKSKIDQQTKLPLSIEYLKVAAYKWAKGE